MKKIFFIPLLLFTVLISQAQIHVSNDTTICRGATAYLHATVEIPSHYQQIYFHNPDSVYDHPIPIGFHFKFYGMTTSYDSVVIAPNGWVGFNTLDAGTYDPYFAHPIPSTLPSVPKNCIMGPWQDWTPYVPWGAYVGYETVGNAPYRRFVVDYFNVRLQTTDTLGVFQIILNETENTIENHITAKPNTSVPSWNLATQGVHNKFGTDADTVPGRNGTAWTAYQDSWKYTPIPPLGTHYQVDPIPFDPVIIGQLSDVQWYRNSYDPDSLVHTGSSFPVIPGRTSTYIAVVILNEAVPYMDSVTVTVRPLPIADAGQDTLIIQGTYALLDGTDSWGMSPLNYHWKPETLVTNPTQAVTPTVTLFNTQLFQLAVRDDLGCKSDTDEVIVVVENSPLFANLTVNKPKICAGDTIRLEVTVYGGDITRPYHYTWWSKPFHSGFLPPDTNVVYATPQDTTTWYYVRVNDANDSTVVDSVSVHFPYIDPAINGYSQVCVNQSEVVYYTDSTGNIFNWSVTGTAIPQSMTENNNRLIVNWGNQGTADVKVVETTPDQYACSQSDRYAVTVFPNPTPIISGTNTMCEGDTNMVYSTPYTAGNHYSWTMVPGNLGTIDHADSSEIIINWSQAGITRLYVTEVTPIGCHNTVLYDVIVNPRPNPFISGIVSVCETDTVVYQTPYNDGNVYTWALTPPGVGEIITPADSNQIMIHWLQPGKAWLSVDEMVTATSCANTAESLPVIVNPNPDILALSPVMEICEGDSVMVRLHGADEYHWSPDLGLIPVDDSIWILKPSDTTTYSITGINRSTGCYDSIRYTLAVKPNPVFDLGEDQFLYPDHPVVLHAGKGFDRYDWSTGDADSILQVIEPGDYWVVVTLYGCSSSDSVSVKIPLAYMPVPNAFTPNDDGINDRFKVVGTIDEVVKFSMQIYDRWGRLVYQTNDIHDDGWDGTYNGAPCPVGAYVWTITFEEKHDPGHVPVTRRGMVTLLR